MEQHSAKTIKLSLEPSKFIINDLPDSVIHKILTHLPGRIAVQCKLVCKHWLSLISNRFFLMQSIHNNHHRDPLLNRFNFVSEDNMLDTNSNFSDTNPEIRMLQKTTSRVVAYFDDLILYRENSTSVTPYQSIYCICNPLTKESLTLPPAPVTRYRMQAMAGFPVEILADFPLKAMAGFVCYPHHCNKNQECTTNAQYGYKVIQIPKFARKSNQWKVDIFCSETSKWSESMVSSPMELKSSTWSSTIVAYNGILHWVNTGLRDSYLIAYDPLSNINVCRIISLPSIIDVFPNSIDIFHNEPLEFVIGVCAGNLRVSLLGGVLFVWELEDYYNAATWRLKHGIQNIHRNIINCRSVYKMMVGFHLFDGDIVYLKFTGLLVSYNMRTRTLQVVCKLQLMGSDVVVMGNMFFYLCSDVGQRQFLLCLPIHINKFNNLFCIRTFAFVVIIKFAGAKFPTAFLQ